MSSIFETIMLVCFGLSWPINVIKAYKARTAKATSLPFILLIFTGYIAGISSKVVSGQMNYVFVVYLINLAIVLLNIVVYFRNVALYKMRFFWKRQNSKHYRYLRWIFWTQQSYFIFLWYQKNGFSQNDSWNYFKWKII